MAMRLSGLMSGMDTESMISQLVEAKSSKLNKTKKTQIKANWKQDAWKDLNTKLKNLQSKYISNMRFSSSYSKKTTKVSNSSAVSVITGENAVNGVQSLEISQLAKTAYLTGAELKNAAGEKADYTALTRLSDLVGFTGEGAFSVKTGSKTVDISVNEDSTISDVLTKIKEAGLNASFDTKTQRFFISAKESGVKNDFSITASDANGQKALAALGMQVNLNDDKVTLESYRKYAGYFVAGDRAQTLANMKDLIDASVASRTDKYLAQYKSAKSGLKSAEDKIRELNKKYKDSPLDTVENYAASMESKKAEIEKLQEDRKNDVLTEDDKKAIDEKIAALNEEVKSLEEKKSDAESLKTQQETVSKLNAQISDLKQYITVTTTTGENGEEIYSAAATGKLVEEEENNYYNRASYAAQVMENYDPDDTTGTGATKITAQDAIISLNGAEFTNNTNVFEINGLTFTALSETKPGESVTVTTQNDTDGLYDMVKSFLKEYNSVINEMDKLYNATSAKGFDPLLTEEKEAMSEKEVEEYEKKIKDAILRGDSNLSSISQGIRGVMSSGFDVNGKTMYLSDLGINMLSYFTAPENERNAYHIDGDADDDNTSGNADKLKGMISSDPETVISFFTKLSQSLYDKMSDMSKSVDGYRSFGNFYDDKKMKSDYDSYNTKIAELEQKLNDYEDMWYSKFAKMETTMAKMQSKTSALSNLFGG